MRAQATPVIAILTVLPAFCAAACGDAFIDPFENEERFYTVWGFLDETKSFDRTEMQVIRIIPVTRTPERIISPNSDNADIDAFVTTTHIETGEQVVWNHELERLNNGFFAHVFKARFFINRGHTYQLDVTRSDGTVASAVTRIPFLPSVTPTLSEPSIDPDTLNVTQQVYIEELLSPWEISVIYHNGDAVCFTSTPIAVPYGRAGAPAENGWAFTINLSADVRALRDMGLERVNVCAMGLKVRMLDDQWTPPEGKFDPEVLAQPGVLSNIENGYGFFGSIGLYQPEWGLSTAFRALINRNP